MVNDDNFLRATRPGLEVRTSNLLVEGTDPSVLAKAMFACIQRRTDWNPSELRHCQFY